MIRYFHVLISFLLSFIVQFARNVYTIVVLRMVVKKTPEAGHEIDDHNDLNVTCLVNQAVSRTMDIVVNVSETLTNSREVEMFDWNEKQVGMLQSAYFIGYMGTMVIGANTVLRVLGQFKGTLVLLVLNLIVFASFPSLTLKFGFTGALISRIALGAVHGPVTSIIAASFFTWIPPGELTLATTVSTMGAGAGAPIANIYAGSLLGKGASWEEAYMSMTSICLATVIIYALFGDEGPEGHKSALNVIRPLRLSNWISGAERDLIVNSRMSQSTKDVPYKKIYTSRAVWVFAISWFFTTLTINLFVTLPPRYAINTMFVPISLYAKVSAIQGPITIPIIIATSAITDRCIAKFGTVTTRRRVHLVFSIMIVVFFLSVLVWPCAGAFNLVMIGNSFFMLGILMACSIKPVPNELGGPFAGQVYAFANAVSNLGNFLAPIIAGGLLDMGPIDNAATWYPVYVLGLACICLSTIIYHCARYDLQDWAGNHFVLDDEIHSSDHK